ncbi:MAG: hypothetical protein AB7I36_08450 [Rhodospirillaceae bacterium]
MSDLSPVKVINDAGLTTPFASLGEAMDAAKEAAAKRGGQTIGVYVLQRVITSTVAVNISDTNLPSKG